MSGEIQIGKFLREHRRRIFRAILLFWAIFAALILIEDELAQRINGAQADPVDRLQYCIRWLLWTFITPLIIALAARFPVRRTHITSDLLKHGLLACMVIGLEFCIEIPIVRAATLRIKGAVQPVADYAAVFVAKLNIYLLLYFLMVGATYFILHMERNHRSRRLAHEAEMHNQQLQTQLAEAKINLLKMQLDPHFLFNTHHSIISLMLSEEYEKAMSMLSRLSDLLRLSLETGEQTIPLERELELLKHYLSIQQIRFGERLRVDFLIGPGTMARQVPAFILQPLVENAMKHCVALSAQPCLIRIESGMQDGQLVLNVINDGSLSDTEDIHEGIGITNTRERLHQLYNGRADFSLRYVPGAGVSALITIQPEAREATCLP